MIVHVPLIDVEGLSTRLCSDELDAVVHWEVFGAEVVGLTGASSIGGIGFNGDSDSVAPGSDTGGFGMLIISAEG